MKIKCLQTGSIGNCFLLTDDENRTLILDAGVKVDQIKKALKFDFSSIEGAIITHGHRDHCLSADTLEAFGVNVFRPYLVEGGRDRRTYGKYAISAFPLEHDNEPCCGFYIKHLDGLRMLYLTDLSLCKWIFKKQEVQVILIEVNYQNKYLDLTQEQYYHKVLGHLSLENCIEFLKVNKTDALKKVIICHQSIWTMDEEECLDRIRQEIGVEVEAARKDKTFYL